MSDRQDAERVIRDWLENRTALVDEEMAREYGTPYAEDIAREAVEALAAAGIPVGHVAALDYAEKLLLSDGAVEAGGGGIYGPGPPPGQPWSRDVAVRLARCVITRAFQQARKEER